MLLAAIRWNYLADHLPEDIPQRVYDDDDIVHVLDIVEDVLKERADWVEPESDTDQQRLGSAMSEGGDLVKEAMLEVLREAIYRRDVLGFDTTLGDLYDALCRVDVLDTTVNHKFC